MVAVMMGLRCQRVGKPGWFLPLIGPIGMGWALLKVTGIP